MSGLNNDINTSENLEEANRSYKSAVLSVKTQNHDQIGNWYCFAAKSCWRMKGKQPNKQPVLVT